MIIYAHFPLDAHKNADGNSKMKSQHLSIIAISVALAAVPGLASAQSVARQWNEVLLNAIRVDTPRPTVHARNLFHLSTGMYDAWAAFDPVARGCPGSA